MALILIPCRIPLTFVSAFVMDAAIEMSTGYLHRCLVGLVIRAIPCRASGREVIASVCLSGIPSRMKIVHQL